MQWILAWGGVQSSRRRLLPGEPGIGDTSPRDFPPVQREAFGTMKKAPTCHQRTPLQESSHRMILESQ